MEWYQIEYKNSKMNVIFEKIGYYIGFILYYIFMLEVRLVVFIINKIKSRGKK